MSFWDLPITILIIEAGLVGVFAVAYVGARLVVRFILREDWNTGESLK